MKVKAGVLFNSQLALSELVSTTLPAKAAYSVARAVRKIQDELRAFEEKRIELIKKHGVEAEGGGFGVPNEKIPEFSKEYEEMANVEVTISDVDEISVSTFGETAPLKATTLLQLGWLLKD